MDGRTGRNQFAPFWLGVGGGLVGGGGWLVV